MHRKAKQYQNVGSLEQRKVYCRAKQRTGGSWSKKTQTHGLFGEVFIGKIWGEGFRMWGFLLIDWWCSNRVVLQGSCAQWKVTSSTWVGALVQRHGFACSSRRNQDPALTLGYCLKTAPPLFLHSLPFLISNCLILPLGT